MRVALIGENCMEYVKLLLSLWSEGYCVALIDWRIPVKQKVKIMRSASVKRCYYINSKIINDEFRILKQEGVECIWVEDYSNSEVIPEEVMIAYRENYSFDEAVILYSSGTTGESKGVILTHYAINTNADSILRYMEPQEGDAIYIVKSFSHSSTLVGELIVGLKSKIKIIVKSTVSNIRSVLSDIDKYRITITCLNPTLLILLVKAYKVHNSSRLNSLKKIYCSGELLDKKYARKAIEFWGCKVINVYGLTEAGPRVTAQNGIDDTEGSVGKPIYGVEVIVVDNNGVIQREYTNGLVHVNTHSKFNGYVNENECNKSLYKDWLNTGDIGYINDKGELFIVGRQDNMLIHNSHNIYPESIENLIKSCDMIDDCVLSKNDTGELVCYYKMINGRVMNKQELKMIYDLCRRELALFEIPSDFQCVKSFHYTNNGKIIRNKSKWIMDY